MLICGPEEYRKSPELSDTGSAQLSLLKLLRKCWNFEIEGRPNSTMCLNQVQLINSGIHSLPRVVSTDLIVRLELAADHTIRQPISQPTITRRATTILGTSALRDPAEESSNPSEEILPTLSISGPSQGSRIPGAETVTKGGVQLLPPFYAPNSGPSQEEHDSLSDADPGTQQGPAQLGDEEDLVSPMLGQSSGYDTTSSSELDAWSTRAHESWFSGPHREPRPQGGLQFFRRIPYNANFTTIADEGYRQVWAPRSGQVFVLRKRALPWASQAVSRQPNHPPTTTTSLSSYGSAFEESDSQVSDPGSHFPSGERTSSQVLATLRTTHARLRSIIAAFIGHINFHSRLSDASSTNQLIDAACLIVEPVRYLWCLADALEGHQGIRKAKPRGMAMLKQACGTLDRTTSEIMGGVKDILADEPIVSEDDGKTRVLLAATDTLEACGECVKALKMCLKTKRDEGEFVIKIDFVPLSETLAGL
ncbi:hypothetical protein FRC01_001488, partial [Tulasnella sp. 417]